MNDPYNPERDELNEALGCLVAVVAGALALFLLYHGGELADIILRRLG